MPDQINEKRKEFGILRGELEMDRASFISPWRELGEFILPRRPRFTITDVNKGDRRSKSIIDSTATFAVRTLSSGMMSGMSSPARPWFRLTTPDPDLAEHENVEWWLDDVTQRMRSVFLRSNLYNALPLLYADLGVFGTAAMLMQEDDEKVMRFFVIPIGSYMLGNDDNQQVRTFLREFPMTTRQIVKRFGLLSVSESVKRAWDAKQFEQRHDVTHIIAPNPDFDPEKLSANHKPFASCYFETNVPPDKFLRESGFDEFPVLAARWEVTGEDVYGTNCPGMMAIGDIKQLQHGEKRAAEGLDKIVRPPMVGPTSLRNASASILPSDITYVDIQKGQQGFQPAHVVDPRIFALEQKQEQVRQRINRAFFADLFLMLASNPQLDRGQKTAREIEERHEEKLLAVGPVLEQLNQDIFDPLIDRAFNMMLRAGQIPTPPRVLEGINLRVEYISIMAQAQKSVALNGLERFAAFMAGLSQVDEQVIDKVDRDELIDEYGEATGIAPRIVVSDERVAQIRQERAARQKALEDAEALKSLSGAAKSLGETDTTQRSALTDLMRGAGGQQVA
jgi:hypothetical protein